MADKQKPVCKFGANCYRKNPQHLQQYRHPKRKSEESEDPKPKKAKTAETGAKGIEQFFQKKSPSKDHDLSDEEEIQDTPDFIEGEPEAASSQDVSDTDSEEEEEELEAPESPADVKDNIKQKFLVDMPDDFYQFWEFCEKEKPGKPSDALKGSLGLQLVGPFDILAGKHKGVTTNRHGKRPNFLLHWRYYYDPPEFQTVIKGDNQTQYHMGYFRDDPKEMPAFVACNSAKTDCIITPRGDNLFAAVYLFCVDELKSKDLDSSKKKDIQDLSQRLKAQAEKHGHSLAAKSSAMKERSDKVVCRSFHGAGIVVPVDENEVGYREVPETPAHLKKMFRKITESKTDSERDKNYEDLQELITLVQFANDECDYGEGLELGMDLFCYGGQVFHTTISQLMPLAYMLLGRTAFQKTITAHLKNRSHTADLSQLT